MGARATVLVADDNAQDRLLLTSIIEAEGYDVVGVDNGQAAINRFSALESSIVMLKLGMPGLEGQEVAQKIRHLAGESHLPIVFLTSLTQTENLLRCVESEGDEFLSKPYHSAVVRTKLAALDRQQQTQRTVQQQRDEISRLNASLLHEQAAAKAVMDRVVHTGSLNSEHIQYLVSPLAVFNGDVLLAANNPGGDLFVFVGDFTGHGLTAGIGAMPLADIFYSMTQKGFSLADLVRETNRKLSQILPSGYFCCATVARICHTKGFIEYWNGGLPTGYLVHADLKRQVRSFKELESAYLPLGILRDEKFVSTTSFLEFVPGDQLLLFTDGLLETRDAQGNMFGEQGLKSLFQSNAPAEFLFEEVRIAVREQRGDVERDDDVTLIAVEMLAPEKTALEPLEPIFWVDCVPQRWRFQYELGPDSLRVFNPLPLMHQIVMEVPEIKDAAGQIYSVLVEAYSNALEHGVLGLESDAKHDADGFADYYAKRQEALQSLSEGFVRFEFDCCGSSSGGELKIRVIDSGPGFDHSSRTDSAAAGSFDANNIVNDKAHYHGRGLPLLSRLCDTVRYLGKGNILELKLCWESPIEEVA